MTTFSTYLDDKILDHCFGGAAYTQPTVYVGLYTTTPTMPAGTGGVEVSGGSYGRVAISSDMAAAAASSKASNTVISFATASADWGTVVGFGFFDASTGGNLLAAAPLSASATVGSGDTFSFPSGDLVATVN